MTTIFDLDYTLLDTVRFKEALADLLGMDVLEFDESYEENFKEKGINYTLEAHLEILKVENKEKILQEFENIDISNCLNKGALKVLLEERIISEKLVLFTFGNEDWQKEKVNRLKAIKDLFDEIIYESKEKENSLFLKKIPGDEELKIINDNFEETLKMFDEIVKSRNGNASGIEVIIIKGPYPENKEGLSEKIHEKCWRYCENIAELSPENKEVEQERKFAIR